MIEEKYRYAAEYTETGIEGIRRTGIKVLELRDRYAKLLMPLAGNVNHVGIMYAGSLFTIGETSGGIIFAVSFDVNKYYPIVKEIHIKFLKPVTTDVTLVVEMSEEKVEEIEKQLEEKGKADFEMDLEIKDANGVVVSAVHGIWPIRTLPEGFPSPLAKR
ncbi:MAG: YiiD C-terminal domain-containing protein [Deltaproteobacteria bacterium]|nr:YiiD C-terminal domain-containing protein [Deltaproteobacteria bacterium]